MKNLQIDTLVLGMVATNCYLAWNKNTREALVVDPAALPDRIISAMESRDVKPVAILLTHGHFDHIGAVDALREKYRIPVLLLDKEQEIMENQDKNLSSVFGRGFSTKADHFLHDGDVVSYAGVEIKVLHTPGHTIGGACYYIPEEQVLFSGDTLFLCSVGRTDFPTGSMGQLHDSIHRKLFVLPDETEVFPGHNEPTSIGYEKQHNPY